MLKRLQIALAQVKTGNTYENLQKEIRKIVYFLYWAKEICIEQKKLPKKYIRT